MTAVCTDDAWTCPTCQRTTRRGLLSQSDWDTHRLRMQRAHGELHRRQGGWALVAAVAEQATQTNDWQHTGSAL